MENNKITVIKVVQDRDNNFFEDGIRELEVKKMRMGQFLTVAGIVKEMVDELNKDENISGALSGIFDGVEEGMDTREILVNASASFYKDAAGSIGKLLQLFPEKIVQIVALAAGMSYEEAQFQEPDVFFAIFDKVVEQNDFEKVFACVKFSFTNLAQSMGWKKVVSESTAPKVIK